jgi:hypothetical protein
MAIESAARVLINAAVSDFKVLTHQVVDEIHYPWLPEPSAHTAPRANQRRADTTAATQPENQLAALPPFTSLRLLRIVRIAYEIA